jgi:hypothetical protein
MATKTITLELDAYEKLKKAKRSERESFSEVVRRARWDESPATGAQLLAHLTVLRRRHPEAFLADDVLDRILERASNRRPRAAMGPAARARTR